MITAVLLSWKRPYHIPEIVRHLRTFDKITEISIYCNEFAPTTEILNLVDERTRLTFDAVNQVTLGRFIAGATAQNEIVFTQDDDLLVHNIDKLLEWYDGTHIVANLADDKSSRHWNWWQVHKLPYVELGFGSLFPRQFCREMPDWPDDKELLRRKADKVFTILNNWKAIRAGGEDLTRLYHNGQESGRDENALSLRKDHDCLTDEAVARALVWKKRNRTTK